MSLSAIVCAYNEERTLPAALHSLFAQTRVPDEVIVVNNASTDRTRKVAAAFPGVTVVDEPEKGLVKARARGFAASSGDILVYIDADCRAPLMLLERMERRFLASPRLAAVTGPYRFYDWDWSGRTLIRLYDWVVAPPAHAILHHALGIAAILYGGNFAVRADALAQIGGFDQNIDFHGEDTNLGRRLTRIGTVDLSSHCWVWTSARRYRAVGKREVIRLYVRNFCSEIVRHRPADREHLDVRA
jgi:glycosyltransferase involved in cell wall biosynthesis